MKKWLLTIMISLLATTSCNRYYGPSPKANTPGLRLDTSQGPLMRKVLINVSEQPIFIDLEFRTLAFIKEFQQVSPGDSLLADTRGVPNIWVTIAWWCEGCQEKIGWSQEELFFSMPGLYSGEPIIVTDLMLRNNSLQRGFILNVGDPVIYQDDRGHTFTLDSGSYVEMLTSAGSLTYFTRPRDSARYRYPYLRTYQGYIDMRKKQYEFDKKLYDFKIVIHEQWRW